MRHSIDKFEIAFFELVTKFIEFSQRFTEGAKDPGDAVQVLILKNSTHPEPIQVGQPLDYKLVALVVDFLQLFHARKHPEIATLRSQRCLHPHPANHSRRRFFARDGSMVLTPVDIVIKFRTSTRSSLLGLVVAIFSTNHLKTGW